MPWHQASYWDTKGKDRDTAFRAPPAGLGWAEGEQVGKGRSQAAMVWNVQDMWEQVQTMKREVDMNTCVQMWGDAGSHAIEQI